MNITEISFLESSIESIRTMKASDIAQTFENTIPQSKIPSIYFGQLNEQDRTTAQRACLLTWILTQGTQVPREAQLQSCLATFNGKDSLVYAGTGSGKTLPVALNILLEDPAEGKITLTISPLKRLQITQENDFNTKYGIPTVAINDSTPRKDEYWNEMVYNTREQKLGRARHIIATVEQLFRTPEGHLPRLAILIRNRHFQKRISSINIDEAHFIHTAGIGHYGLPAFRAAWGELSDLKVLLPSLIPWRAMSATFPPHILKTVESEVLRTNYIHIRTTSNRPDTMYATHCVPTTIRDPKNYLCFLTKPFNIQYQPRVLIFFDNRELTQNVATYLESALPQEFRDKGVVRFYHSAMSEEFLITAHHDFTATNGCCKVLCATSGESVGVDFPDVQIVCNAGLPTNIVDLLQRTGRLARRDGDKGLAIIFYENWALKISPNEFQNGDVDDPDRPRTTILKATSNVRARAGLSSIGLIQEPMCLRKFFASYLADESPIALDYSTDYCCDRHPIKDNQNFGFERTGFEINTYLPSPLFAGDILDLGSLKRKNRTTYRKPSEREALDTKITDWLKNATQNDPLQGIRASYDILSYSQRVKLVVTPPEDLYSREALVSLLEESKEWADEWADSLYMVIADYNASLKITKRVRKSV